MTVDHDIDTFQASSIFIGQCGRPRLNVAREQLEFLLECRLNSPQIPVLLEVNLANKYFRVLSALINSINILDRPHPLPSAGQSPGV